MSAPGPVRSAPDTRDDWETPDELFSKLNEVFRFEVDAAASRENAKCDIFIDAEADALGLSLWGFGDSIWCNPPYGKGLMDWVKKFSHEASQNMNTVVALLPNATDTKWGQFVIRSASEVWFLSPRVQFVGTTSSNPSGSMIAIWRPEPSGLSVSGPSFRAWDWK